LIAQKSKKLLEKTMTRPRIKTVTATEEEAAINVVVLAFSADPAARWLYPDSHQYRVNFPNFVRAFGGEAFEQGSAYSIDGCSGVALWLPPDVHPNEEAIAELIQRTVCNQRQEEIFALLEQMGGYHPSEPHWYLPLIGVDPALHGKGYGSRLMVHALSRCDRDKKLAYLESSNPKNISFYERHGFELLGTIQVGGSPPMFPMLRKPQAGAWRQLDESANWMSSQ
jgi:ribosomal protein S18 acetylase RimI-like enzyme